MGNTPKFAVLCCVYYIKALQTGVRKCFQIIWIILPISFVESIFLEWGFSEKYMYWHHCLLTVFTMYWVIYVIPVFSIQEQLAKIREEAVKTSKDKKETSILSQFLGKKTGSTSGNQYIPRMPVSSTISFHWEFPKLVWFQTFSFHCCKVFSQLRPTWPTAFS